MSLNPSLESLFGSHPPRLLVSVRNVTEAAAAIRGGCDILDIKEPRRGSLGMASPDVLLEIAQYVRASAPQILVTAALGEVHEHPLAAAFANLLGQLPAMDFVKLGCATLAASPSWPLQLRETRAALSRRLNPQTGWVAVAYADAAPAGAPPLNEIIEEAIGAGCRGVLIDTYGKSGRGLLDWLGLEQLHHAATQLHANGLFLALAGSLKREDLEKLSPVAADIIAIRGAACACGLRTDSIEEQAVRDFHQTLNSCWRQ